jgi:ABC-type bacteriocin/lantibiotic exporter with double-glycine peptidase domain
MRLGLRNIPLLVLAACTLVSAGEPAAVWLDVPFVKQEKNGCGAASIAMVMQYWQRQQSQVANASSDAEEIQKVLYAASAHGVYASEMEHYFHAHGYETFAFAGRVEDLRIHLGKGRPLIVALKPSRGAPLHYLVIAGYNPSERVVLLNDPAERKLLKRDLDTFEKEWRGTGHWTLLAVPSSPEKPSAL